MRILLLNYEYPPFGGGAAIATKATANALVSMGHTVHVLTSQYDNSPKEERVDGVTIYRVPNSRISTLEASVATAYKYVWNAWKWLRNHPNESYDVLHSFFAVPTGLTSLLSHPYSAVPHVVSLRGSDVPHHNRSNTRIQRMHTLITPITKKVWRNAAAVVSVTTSLANTANKTDPSLKIRIIPNGINTDLFFPPKPFPNDKLPTSNAPIQLVCVGRLTAVKGIDQLINGLSLLSSDTPWHLTLIGDGPDRLALQEQAKHLNIGTSITFTGYLSPENVSRILRQSDMFTLTSRAEAFGNVFLEAMACGLPIIGSDIGGIPDLVTQDNGLLVDPNDEKAIRHAIHTLAQDPARRAKIRRINSKKARTNYSWHASAKQYADLYASLLEEKK